MNAPRQQPSAETMQRFIVDPGPWLSCDECFRLVDQYVERRIDAIAMADRQTAQAPTTDDPLDVEMRAHLRGCTACSQEALTLLVLAAAEAGLDPVEAERHFLDD